MKASAERFGLTVHLEEIAPLSWLQVVRSKVNFLERMREMHEGPLLYVDVDAVFHADPWPLLEMEGADVSFAWLLDNKARSGTIYLADSIGARVFLADWQCRLNQAPDAWDQHPLNDIVKDSTTGAHFGYRWQNLPPGLCYIFDKAERTAGVGVTAVIEHLQASREMRDPHSVLCKRRRERVREIEASLNHNPDFLG